MWGKNLFYFHDIWKDVRLLILFNTLKASPEGLTYYDLQKFGKERLNPTAIYRMMNNLYEQKYLKRIEEQNEQGRPKYKFFISEKGEEHAKFLKKSIMQNFEFIKESIPKDENQEFDMDKLIDSATFHIWREPISTCLHQNISNEEKMEFFVQLESKLLEKLESIRKHKHKLEKTIEKEKSISKQETKKK